METDDAFACLEEIEKMTAQNEVDLARYQSYTEKRYNTERFFEEMEMKREFPGLSAALDIERESMLKQVDSKIENKKLSHNQLRGKDIVNELLEQSIVHEELDKIRRDLDEFSYKTKDASHLLNLPFINPYAVVESAKVEVRDSVTQTKEVDTSVAIKEGKLELIKLKELPELDLNDALNLEHDQIVS